MLRWAACLAASILRLTSAHLHTLTPLHRVPLRPRCFSRSPSAFCVSGGNCCCQPTPCSSRRLAPPSPCSLRPLLSYSASLRCSRAADELPGLLHVSELIGNAKFEEECYLMCEWLMDMLSMH